MTISYQSNLNFKRAVHDLQLKLSALRLSFQLTSHAYDPNQPRVPAGYPDGGQWTDAGGASGSNSPSKTSIGSNSSSGSIFNDAGREEVAGRKRRPTKPVKPIRPPLKSWHMDEDEGKLGFGKFQQNHTKARHIGWNDSDLADRINYDRWPHLFDNNQNIVPKRIPKRIRKESGSAAGYFGNRAVQIGRRLIEGHRNKGYYKASSFRNDKEALYFIRQTLIQNKTQLKI